MGNLLRKNAVLLVISLLSMAGLLSLSHLTIVDFLYTMEEEYDRAANDEIIRELESSIEYGKSLDSYYGLHGILRRAASLLREGTVLAVEGGDGAVLAVSEESNLVEIDRSAYGELRQEIHNPDGSPAGVFTTWYPLAAVRSDASQALWRSILASAALFVLLVVLCLLLESRFHWTLNRVTRVIIAIVLIQSAILTVLYVPRFQAAAERNVRGIGLYLENTLDAMMEKGIALEDIDNLDEILRERQERYQWIEEIALRPGTEAREQANMLVIPLRGSEENLCMLFHISESYLRGNVAQMLLTYLATVFLAVVCMMEFLPLSGLNEFRRSAAFNTASPEQYASLAPTLRCMSFLSATFVYICLSFSALLIKEWNRGFLGMDAGTAAALSISLCSLAEAGGVVAMPVLSTKLKPRRLMLGTTTMLILVNFSCFLTHSVPVLLMMRFLSGICTAGHKQVVSSIIAVGYSSEAERAANLSANNYGIIGGILCGLGLGSIIAGTFGYAATFFAAGLGSVLYLAYCLHYLPWKLFDAYDESNAGAAEKAKDMLRALADPGILPVVLRIVVPHYFLLMAIVVLVPGRVQSAQMPGLVLTYANLLNGIFGLYLGAYLGRFLQKYADPVRTLAIMIAASALAMVLLSLPVFPVAMVILGSIIFGLFDGVATPVATDLFLGNAHIMSHLDEATSMMLYSMLGNVVATAAPLVLERCEGSRAWMYGSAAVLLLISLSLFTVRRKGRK